MIAAPSPDTRTAPMALLRSGVPLSLLMDLALGPCSEEILRDERAEQHPPAA